MVSWDASTRLVPRLSIVDGDWCADEFYGAVVGLRIEVAALNDPTQLKALQDQARLYLEALRPLIPGATGDIQMHQIVQAG